MSRRASSRIRRACGRSPPRPASGRASPPIPAATPRSTSPAPRQAAALRNWATMTTALASIR
ncbi:MAG: hypothetical protein B7Z39_01415 [Novosphingobium sp. 12-64-8]|nr:MAG: hypothetical protein B7Z39_01415 [Novosphingobium sp. 12-64-8]